MICTVYIYKLKPSLPAFLRKISCIANVPFTSDSHWYRPKSSANNLSINRLYSPLFLSPTTEILWLYNMFSFTTPFILYVTFCGPDQLTTDVVDHNGHKIITLFPSTAYIVELLCATNKMNQLKPYK